jgi:NAD(P)-dependent dehydrogenase (short-subunit alcohol dehydrogenase family)
MQNGWLKEKVIVIIGGTTGLGLAAAFRCIEEGGYVVVVGRDEERTRQAEEILGPASIAISGDAVLESTAENAIQAAVQKFGGFFRTISCCWWKREKIWGRTSS